MWLHMEMISESTFLPRGKGNTNGNLMCAHPSFMGRSWMLGSGLKESPKESGLSCAAMPGGAIESTETF